jgi:putative colanic acid biosynthesis acetyltransferase WcaF
MVRDLRRFKSRLSLRAFFYRAAWYFAENLFMRPFFVPSKIKSKILRIFGAQIGSNVIFRRNLRIQLPMNLIIGDNCWIGEEVWFINHERISIGSDVCISQRSVLCSGGHDYRSAWLEYSHKPIEIMHGAWICLDAKVLPGVTIGKCSVVSAGEVAHKSLADYSMLIGGQIRPIKSPK